MDNQDLLRPSLSFNRAATVSSPKGTFTFLPPESASFLPTVSLSYGQAFHIDDPRIGTTAIPGGTVVAKARAYQLVASKTVAKTEFRLTLLQARVVGDAGQLLGGGDVSQHLRQREQASAGTKAADK